MLLKLRNFVFRRPSARHFCAPQLLSFIEQLTFTELLGIHMFTSQQLFLLLNMLSTSCLLLVSKYITQPKSRGLSPDALHIIFTATVLSVVTYALPSFDGQLSKGKLASVLCFGKMRNI